ncbi:MAG: hypothetical protein PHH14_02160 [Candidatus Margulisbacteria bacterium]|nr:hypothetical protein [Candidatus Margulisiibacteriota bacterium]
MNNTSAITSIQYALRKGWFPSVRGAIGKLDTLGISLSLNREPLLDKSAFWINREYEKHGLRFRSIFQLLDLLLVWRKAEPDLIGSIDLANPALYAKPEISLASLKTIFSQEKPLLLPSEASNPDNDKTLILRTQHEELAFLLSECQRLKAKGNDLPENNLAIAELNLRIAALSNSLGKINDEARAYSLAGRYFFQNNKLEPAATMKLKAAKLYAELNNHVNQYYDLLAAIKYYGLLGNKSQIAILQKELTPIQQIINNDVRLANRSSAQGKELIQAGKYEAGIDLKLRAAEIYWGLREPVQQANELFQASKALLDSDQLDQLEPAINLTLQAIDIHREREALPNNFLIGRLKTLVAACHKHGELAKAGELSLRLFVEIKNLGQTRNSLTFLLQAAEFFRSANENEKAEELSAHIDQLRLEISNIIAESTNRSNRLSKHLNKKELDDEYISQELSALATLFTQAGQQNKLIDRFTKIKLQLNAAKKFSLAAEAAYFIAQAYDRWGKTVHQAKELENAAQAYARAKNLQKVGDLYVASALIEKKLGNYQEGIRKFQAAATAYRNADRLDLAIKAKMSLATLYKTINNNEKRADEISIAAGYCRKIKEFNRAFKLAQLAASLYEEVGVPVKAAAEHHNIAKYFIYLGETKQAIELLSELLVQLKSLRDTDLLPWVMINLGYALISTGEAEKGDAYIQEGKNILAIKKKEKKEKTLRLDSLPTSGG